MKKELTDVVRVSHILVFIFLLFNSSAIAQTDVKMTELDCFTWGKPEEGTKYWTFLEQKGINVGGSYGDRNIRILIPGKELVIFNDEICLRWVKSFKDVVYEFSIVNEQRNKIYKISSLECGVRLRISQFMDADATGIQVLMAKEHEDNWGASYKIIPMSDEEHERILNEIKKLPRLPQPQAAMALVDFYLSKGLIVDALTVLENRLAESPNEEALINRYWEIMTNSRDILRR